MVFNLIIWTAFLMSLLTSLYFSYMKLKIHYRGMKHFIYGQVLISVGFILLWFFENTKFYNTAHWFNHIKWRFLSLTGQPEILFYLR